MKVEIPRSPSPDSIPLLGGILLSPEVETRNQSSPSHDLPVRAGSETYDAGYGETFRHSSGSSPRPIPNSSASLGFRGSTQWEPHVSPPENFLGIVISEDEDETASEADEGDKEKEGSARPAAENVYEIEPNTVARRASYLIDVSDESDE